MMLEVVIVVLNSKYVSTTKAGSLFSVKYR